MNVAQALVAGAAAMLAAPCSAQWWWPPSGGLSVSPACISGSTQPTLTVSGQWPDNCVPNFITALVNGTALEVTTVRDPPPGICLTVITNWSLSVSVGPLTPGVYTVFVTHRVAGQVVFPRVEIGTLTVVATCGSGCYANCDGSTSTPVLTANDFACFLNRYVAGESYADCDGVGGLTANDFACFITAYVSGCS